ncbi:MAG: class I SAM-dependent methyltransferase [Lysobacterales bacterium]
MTLRRRWADTLYPALVKQCREQVGTEIDEVTDADVRSLPAYPWFSWLERGCQKMLWRVVTDAVRAGALEKPDTDAQQLLALDDSLQLPEWYTAWDIHVQPGGVWSSDEAAAVYEAGAKLVMLGENDDYGFHHLFTRTAIPDRPYRKIVDLGCGFGKSTWPLKEKYPDAEVLGIDLSAPCLRLAACKVQQRGLDVHFLQADGINTGLSPSSVDLLTSTMLVHEMPVDALEQLLEEAARILAPGGTLRFLDFRHSPDPLRNLSLREHGARNNEPFLPAAMAADLSAMAYKVGLANPGWRAFDERSEGLLPSLDWPERDEWHFPWAVFAAEKPQMETHNEH